MGSQQSSEASSAADVSPGQDQDRMRSLRGGFLIEPSEDVDSQQGEEMRSVETATAARDENAEEDPLGIELMAQLRRAKRKAAKATLEATSSAEARRLISTFRSPSLKSQSPPQVIESPMLDRSGSEEFDASM
ncbi:unnamed protein product [Polarella glacialis]|uniref:Uncharacterized protein n=1 Tax=Polarella glacialis TaxID=89957 RepID=A0A813IPP2_POLGL|nr:unnamed protein product [Polarella glacialis]